jgi:hypothetical protein
MSPARNQIIIPCLLLLGALALHAELLAVLMCAPGVLQSLLGELVGSQVVSFAMSCGSCAVSVRRTVM